MIILIMKGILNSMEAFTDDGHVKALINWNMSFQGNEGIILLLLEIHPNQFQHDKYTRKEKSWLDVLADVSALSSQSNGISLWVFIFPKL